MTLDKKALETLWEKEKMLVTAFSPFPTMISILLELNFDLGVIFILWSANALSIDQSKNLPFGKG